MKSKTARLHSLLVLLAVAMASILFVAACGGGGEATAGPQAVEETEVPEVTEEAKAAELAELAEAAEGIVLHAEVAEVAAPAEEGAPKYGGTLRFAFYVNNVTLDPLFGGFVIDIAILQAAYDNLLMIQPDLSVKPELATHWEANDDLSSYTFYLREGVKFHHGKEFKAEDVLSTFERLMDPVVDSPARATFSTVIKDVVALDDYTVRFDLVGPNAFFLDTLSIYQARIVPSDVDVERLYLEEFGTGPFIIEEYLPGERTTMVRNPDYWEQGKPYLDELVILFIPEAATRAEMLKSGDVELVYQLEPQSVAGIADYPDTVVLNKASLSWNGLVMRVDTSPFDNKLVRQAMQAATDRQSINQAALLGLGIIARDHPVPPIDPRFAPQYAPPEYNPELAKQLLAEAGYPDGIDVTLHTADVGSGLIEMALAFKESAAPAGIRVDVVRTAVDVFWDEMWNHEAFTVTFWYGRPNPDQALSIQIMSDVAWNAPRYNNAELDELIIKARGQDLEGQIETYAEVQRIMIDDVPRIIPAFQPWIYGARANVRGVTPHWAGGPSKTPG